MKRISLIFVILCSLVACTPSSVIVFPIDETLTPKLMPLQGVTSPIRVEVKHPYLIVQNTPKQRDSLFHVYNLSNHKLVSVFGRMGEGPDDFVAPWLLQTCLPEIVINNKRTFYHFNINENKEAVLVDKQTVHMTVANAETALITDSTFVVDERYTGPNLYLMNVKDELPLKKYPYRNPEIIDYTVDPQMGNVVANGNRIVLYRGYEKEIVFMDTNFNLIKKVSFDFDAPQEINGDNVGDVNISYNYAYLGKRYLYVQYFGTSWNKLRENDTCGSYIEVFDLDGNPIARYLLNGRRPVYYAVDEETFTLYGPGEDFNPEDNLLVYQLKGLSK